MAVWRGLSPPRKLAGGDGYRCTNRAPQDHLGESGDG